MDAESIRVKIEAQYEQFKKALKEAADTVSQSTGKMREDLGKVEAESKAKMNGAAGGIAGGANQASGALGGLSGAVAGVTKVLGMLGAAVAAGAYFQKSVAETVAYTTESQRLSRALSITASQASVLAIAIGDVYGSTDQYIAMAQGMNRQLRTNEEGLQKMGLQTRDANGELRDQQDLLMDGLALLRNYKEGTDRNLAAQQMFGRSLDVSSEMLALNAETIDAAKQKAEDLALVVGQENVEASNAYRAAMNDVGDVTMAMTKATGDALMPVLTELAVWFADIGPAAVTVIKGAIGGLVAVYHGLMMSIKVVWEVAKGFFNFFVDAATATWKAMSALMEGDLDGALVARDELWAKMKSNASNTFEAIATDARETSEKLWNLFARPEQSGESGAGTKSYEDPNAGKEEEAKRKAALAAQKKLDAELRRQREEQYRARMDELRDQLSNLEGHYDEQLVIARKMLEEAKKMYGEDSREYKNAAQRILEIEREKQAELGRIKQLQRDAALMTAQAGIEAAQMEADYQLAIGAISNEERIAAQLQFEDARFQLALGALYEKLALLDTESEAYQQMLNNIQQLELEHGLRVQQIRNDFALAAQEPAMRVAQTMEQSFQSSLDGLLNRTMSLRQALQNVWQQIYTSYLQEMVTKPLAAYLRRIIMESTLGKWLMGVQTATQAAASAKTIAAKTSETAGVVGQNAAQAASGAAASQAGIPIVGPALAMAAMAAIFAAVMGLAGGGGGTKTSTSVTSIPSAANGYDIPSGVNPMTQLHEREMVLPEAQADVIREMASGGGGFGGGNVTVQIKAFDSADVRRLFLNERRALADALKQAVRDGAR